jgi:hypothetical protein
MTSWKPVLPWALTVVVSLLAIYVWGHSFGWDFRAINAYQFFPVLGLLAFSVMWSHYMIGNLKRNLLVGVPLESYFRYTGYIVLGCIVFHPGILIYQLFRDGFGLPPGSYEHFVAPGMAWITLLGTASLLAFLAFELHRWYGKRTWWKYVIMAGDVAMVAIFYHGLRLGSQLQGGWYQIVWWVYGVTLVAVLIRKYARLLLRKPGVEQTTDW